MHQLLVEEEDKLGHNFEALEVIEKYIVTSKGHVNRQQALIASAECNGHDTAQVRVLLKSYSEILLAFENQREKVLIRLQQSRL